MATISSSIQMFDGMSPALKSMNSALKTVLSSFEAMQRASSKSVDNSAIKDARNELAKAETILDKIEDDARKAGQAQQGFNNDLRAGGAAADALGGKIKAIVGAVAGLAGARKAMSWIQDTTGAFDVQRSAETQLMSVMGNMIDWGKTPEFIVGIDDTLALNQAGELISKLDGTKVEVTPEMRTDYLLDQFGILTDKAAEIQSRGIYGDEAMIAAAGELATYMSDTDAITMMMDTLSNYAMGMSGGGELDTTAMVDYATNLGKIMTGAYDAMTKKGFEFTDAQKAVIDGTATQAQYVEALGEGWQDMSEDMRAATVISDIVNESWNGLYETMSNTPEGKIIQMKNAFGDMKEVVGGQLYPYLILLVDSITANWGVIQGVLDGVTTGLQFVMGILSWVTQGIFQVAQAVQDNWSVISPILAAMAAALLLYAGYQLYQTAVTVAQMVAQWDLNAAIAACPIVWIIGMIIAVIAIIYSVAQAIANATGIAQTGFGVITGAISVVIAFFQQLFSAAQTIFRNIGSGAEALGYNMQAAFHNSIANIQAFFYNLLSTAMSVISQIASALSALPFVEFDAAGLAGMATDYADKAQAALDTKMEYKDIGAALTEGMTAFTGDWAGDAFKKGSSWGDGVADSISNALSFDNLFGAQPVDDMGDLASAIAQGGGEALDDSGIPSSSGGTAGNTAKMADAMTKTDEELKYLREIAEQEAINRYTTAAINIDMSNMSNNVSSSMGIDEFMDALTDSVEEAVFFMAEGVHV